MTNLAICKICRALTDDNEEDIGIHRREAHTVPDSKIERARAAAASAATELKLLRAAVRDYEKGLDQRQKPLEPEINLRVVEDDELDPGDIVAPLDDETEEPASEAYEDAVAAFGPSETSPVQTQVYNALTGLYEPAQ